jgi:hypothetical protein
MENIEIVESPLDNVKHIIIDHGDGSFTSMTKEHYDKLQAEQSTPIVEVE